MDTDRKPNTTNMGTFSPTEYIQQFSLNPEKIMFNSNEFEEKKSSSFTSHPNIVVFSNFDIGQVYSACISISNKSQYPHCVKLAKSEDISFKVTFKGSTLNTRLAPGMALLYQVEFHPDEKRDYFYEAIFQAENETFTVPMIAIGPRALLSFPDEIDMERTAVKICKTKPFLMRNVGDNSTGFSIFTDNPSFTVSPSKGFLNAGDALQVQISFTPFNLGISTGFILLRYECGDTVRTAIYGDAELCDVRVLNTNIEIEKTYLGLSRQVSIEILNNSDYILSYEWVKYKSTEEDQAERERWNEAMEPTKKLFLEAKLSSSTQELMCERIYSDDVEYRRHEIISFNDNNFNLFPMSGEIWPRNSTNVFVTFIPIEVNDIFTVAYLEIRGLENRIPVSLKGKCIGPALELNLLSLDIGQAYLCSDYNYEIICKNDGPIPGTLKFMEKDATFGCLIKVEPSEINIDTNERKIMKLIFTSDQTGNFVERVDFSIKESSEVLSFAMKGIVICPLVRVDKEEIRFDAAAIGFTLKKQICYRNLSHAPIAFDIRALNDGYEDPLTYEEFARAQRKPGFPVLPREFAMSPSNGIAEPKKLLRIQLFYTPNIIRSEIVFLQVSLCKSPNTEQLLLPIHCHAESADFKVDPPEVEMPSCYINLPYCVNLVITNNSNVEGYFDVSPQEVSIDTPLLYSLSIYQGCLKPGESKEVTLTVIIQTIEQQEITIKLSNLGFEIARPCCKVTCSGQGPLVFTDICQLNWGEVNLLQNEFATLELINESPISAEYTCAFSKNKIIWMVEPAFGTVEANASATLNVSILLKDKGKYVDHLLINILNGKTIDVKLLAIGVGSSLVYEPQILPEFNMGLQFSKQDISIPLTIKNEGNKHHYVLLTNVEKVRQIKNLEQDMENTLFKIQPNIIELQPGEEKVVQCKVRWNANESISEQWYIFATIDGQGKRELMGSSVFTATFIKPNVTFNKNELSFRLDLGYKYEMLQEKDILEIKNECGRNVNAHLTVEPPFLITNEYNCVTDHMNILLENEKIIALNVCCPFENHNLQRIPQTFNGNVRIEYEEHKQIDNILCKAAINYPHLVFEPNDIKLYCVVGYSAEERVKIKNDSPLPVFYKMQWIKESFVYQNLAPTSQKGSEEMLSKENYLDDSITSISTIKYQDKLLSDSLDLTIKSGCQCSMANCKCSCNSSLIDKSDKFFNAEDYEVEDEGSAKSSSEHSLFSIDILDRFLQIIPEEGQIAPYTEQFICFTFNGYENASVSAKAVCKIKCGSSQILNITAIADFVKCRVEDYELDYGLQLYNESSIRTLKVTNQSMIPICWSIETSSNLLQIAEAPTILKPLSENVVLVKREFSLPGFYNERILLEITHLKPFLIDVKWFATMPQIYLDAPRNNSFKKYPVEWGYEAVRLFMAENSAYVEKTRVSSCSWSETSSEITEFSEYRKLQLIVEDEWQIISKEDKCISRVDIDMAFERIILRDYWQANNERSQSSHTLSNNEEESCLYAPAYILNMGFVVVDQIAQLSIPLHNYGYEKAKVKFRKDEKKRKILRTCFFLQFQQNVEICQCENSILKVIFSPKKDMFTQKRSDVSYKLYFEIKHGLTIPVHIKATAVYPYATVSVETLNFEKVFTGDCKEMSFLLKNGPFVASEWQVAIEDSSKYSAKFPITFYTENISGVLNPNEESIIKIFFKPFKQGWHERNLIVTVSNSQEQLHIKLMGYGQERKLKININDLEFPPVLPNTVLEEDIVIENSNPCPIEVYWRHLTNFSEINTIIRVLKQYYNKNEILVPRRRINENISPILINFYNNLVYEMSLDREFEKLIENVSKPEVVQKENKARVNDSEKHTSIKDRNKSIDALNVEKIDNFEVASTISNSNSNEIETLLLAYIKKLQKHPNFLERMKDPLGDLHETSHNKAMVIDNSYDTSEVKKSLIIIFYGGPFTEYQEKACKSAKSLNLPLLNLNKVFLEALAFSESESAKKLAELIDKRYKELIGKLIKIKSNVETSKKETPNASVKVDTLLKKLPPQEELSDMDRYSVYEHKIETMTLISNFLELSDSSIMSKGKKESNTKDGSAKRQSILPGAPRNLFIDILRDRISQSKFITGYVLQTLNNEYITNEANTLKMLLQATGKFKVCLFLSFFNSFELYERRFFNTNTRDAPLDVTADSNKIMKNMKDYQTTLRSLLEVIREWELGVTKVPDKYTKSIEPKETSDLFTDLFYIWNIYASDPWDEKMYNTANLQILLNFKDILQNNSSSDESSTSPLPPSNTYSILKEYELCPQSSINQIFTLLTQITDSVPESSKTSSTLPLSDNDIEHNLQAQMILQPHEIRKFKLIVKPIKEGRFKGEFSLGFLDDADTVYNIKIKGMADVPKINMSPYSIFNRIKNTKLNDAHRPTYFMDTQTYDFGSLLISKTNAKTYKKIANIALSNTSAVPATIAFTLQSNNFEDFVVEPTEITIDPHKIKSIEITAYASKLGVIVDDLILSIENGESERIRMQSNGIQLMVDIAPRQITLDRVLLHRAETRTLTMENRSEITIYWRLSTGDPSSRITLSPAAGKIKSKNSCEIQLQYYADKLIPPHTIFVVCELFLNEKDRNPIETNIITLTAENYELLFDINTDNPLDFKTVTVGSTNDLSFIIKNLGIYDIAYEIQQQHKEILKNICDVNMLMSLDHDFKFHPNAGIVQSKKQAIIKVTYTPTAEITLKSLALFDCRIIEPYNNIGLVNKSTLNISAISYYTRFSVEPHPQLDFGILGLKTLKTMQLKIENTGKIPLKYSLMNRSSIRTFETSSVKKGDRATAAANKKPSKSEKMLVKGLPHCEIPLICGPFTLESSEGELESGKFHVITVQCCSDAIGSIEEKLSFVVPNSLPADEQNGQISLVAEIHVAQINFDNYTNIFVDSYIVESIEDFDCPNDIDAHTVFENIGKCLRFERVCAGKTHTTSITLHNTSTVSGLVIIQLNDNSTAANTFAIDTNNLPIPPMGKQSFKLSFTPTVLGDFSSSLTMHLDLPPDLPPQIFTIDLQGEGYVPEICVIDPATDSSGMLVLDFGLCLVSDLPEKVIKIQNTGQVTATITIEVLNDAYEVYSIPREEKQNKLSCGCSIDVTDAHVATLHLLPKEIADMKIRFTPKNPESYKSSLTIVIENNPYESVELIIIGKAFSTSVILENLEILDTVSSSSDSKTRESLRTLRKKSSKHNIYASHSTSKVLSSRLLSYKLDYGACFLNHMSKINFRIKNKTRSHYFKFEWSTHPNVVCLPAAGHLAPESFKELTATFLAWEPTTLTQVPVECIIFEIILDDPSVEPSWDSRQTNVNWMEKTPSLHECESIENQEMFLKKIVTKTIEPKFQIVSESVESINLLVSAVSDYSDYFCNIGAINFDDTLMLQLREHKLTLKNTGLVNLDYSWELTMDEHYPIRLDSAAVDSISNLTSCLSETISRARTERASQMQSAISEEFHEVSDLFSSSAGLTDRSTDSWIEGENWPFEITPKAGSLASNEVAECILKFLPMDVFEYKAYLRCKMENLHPNKEPVNIVITAKSLLPYCHFEIEDSDYITSGRRDSKLPGLPGYSLADPETIKKIRVVEFKMMGIGTCHTRSISFINPTSEDYRYRWSKLSNEMQNQPVFQCVPQTGLVEKGKRCKIVFSYIAEQVGYCESYWQFEIKKYNLKTLFLIVANVYEPSVTCMNKIINIEPCALGETKSTSFDITNREDRPLHFHIVSDTLYSEKGKFQVLNIFPMSDILKPNSSQIFKVEYKSSSAGEHRFNVHCNIENLSKSINILFTVQVHELLFKVVYIDDMEQEIDMMKNSNNVIDIGQVMLCESNHMKFRIINEGLIDIHYTWMTNNPQDNECKLIVCENTGTTKYQSSSYCYLDIVIPEKTTVCNVLLTLLIKYGPIYRFKINALAKKLPVKFSFSFYDFGPCYIQTQEGYMYTRELEIKNNYKIPCSIKCNFEDKPHLKLDLNQLPCTIPANTTAKIIVNFRPVEETVYIDTIPLLINGITQKDIRIEGEGIAYKIRLKDPCDALIDFGTIAVGKSLLRKISLINEGRFPAKVKVMLKNRFLTNNCEIEEKLEENTIPIYLQPVNSFNASASSTFENGITSNESLEVAEFIEISPTTLRDLKPNKEIEITIKCRAIKRVQSLTANLNLAVDNSIFQLALVKAHCVKTSYHLNRSYISFGAIYESCTTEEKLVLINDGDINIKFKWRTKNIKPHFDIMPICGCCFAGSEITFSCTFNPIYPGSSIKSEAILEIRKHKNLLVTFTGDCRPIPEPSDIVTFSTYIGQPQVKEMEIQNDSDQPWILTPLLIGEYFTIDKTLYVDSMSNKLFSITYKPLRMSAQEHIHKGKLVIFIPTGKRPIVYELRGTFEDKVIEKCIRKVPAKKRIVETILIRNASDRQQIFECKVDEVRNDNRIINRKFERVNVNADSELDYKYSFLFDEEGQYSYKITIDNNNANIRVYNFEFTVTTPEVVQVVDLTTYVRCPVLYNLKIENLSKFSEVRYELKNDNDDITVHGLPAILASSTFKILQIEYLPLLACQRSAVLEITTEVFGSAFYEFHLSAKAASPEKIIQVKSVLGNSVNFRIQLKNYSKKDCEFYFTVDNTALKCPESLTVAAKQTSSVEIRFEPDSLETVNASVTATSITAGEYVFPIIGLCTPPRPQGPLEVTEKAPAIVNFKNVFNNKKDFEFTVDNRNFTINCPVATIEAKMEKNILVSLGDVQKNKNDLIVGKLIVTCKDKALSAVKWIYYLKGVADK